MRKGKENNIITLGEMVRGQVYKNLRFVPEADALPDEIKAIKAANRSIAAEGTISHEEIDWN